MSVTQEQFEAGVAGTIIQGFVHRFSFNCHRREARTVEPCRCFWGHNDDAPLGEPARPLCPFDWQILAAINDRSEGLDDFRARMSEYALEHGLDDSVCWMDEAA